MERTTEMLLSVIRPAPLDFSALPPAIQATLKGTAKEGEPEQLRNYQVSAEKNGAASAESTPKNLKPPELQRQSREDAYGVADRPPSFKKPMLSQQSYGVADRPMSAEGVSYGVADRPPSIKEPMLPQQSYGVADRQTSLQRMADAPTQKPSPSQLVRLSMIYFRISYNSIPKRLK